MSNLVFLEPNKIDAVPFTTSKIISEYSQVGHKKIKIALDKHKTAIETFGLLVLYETESNGGRPEVIYKLNEQQAALLMTLLKNTEPVIKFKVELVRQFYLMRAELLKRQMLRADLKSIRRELTDVIQDNQSHGKWDFKLYTDLAYKSALGKNAAQIRKDRNANKKDTAVDYMSSDEIAKISRLQSQIGVLLEMGMDYQQIKSIVLYHQLISKIA